VARASSFLHTSSARVSPPRLRAPLDVLFLLGTATLIAAAWEWWRRRSAGPSSEEADATPSLRTVDLTDGQVRVRP